MQGDVQNNVAQIGTTGSNVCRGFGDSAMQLFQGQSSGGAEPDSQPALLQDDAALTSLPHKVSPALCRESLPPPRSAPQAAQQGSGKQGRRRLAAEAVVDRVAVAHARTTAAESQPQRDPDAHVIPAESPTDAATASAVHGATGASTSAEAGGGDGPSQASQLQPLSPPSPPPQATLTPFEVAAQVILVSTRCSFKGLARCAFAS